MIQLIRIPVGVGSANCYIIYNEKEALIIDPGAEADRIKNKLTDLNVQPLAILLTHTHYDHIGAVDNIREEYDLPVYVSPEENDWLADPSKNLSAMLRNPIRVKKEDYLFNPDEHLTIGDFSFRVLATPGHSPGGLSFVFDDERFVISGDALFAGGVGRSDFPGSDRDQLFHGIREKLFSLPDDYTVYSGHGPKTTIEEEKTNNPFFN